MNTLTIKASLRSDLGANGAKQLRNNGMVPAVVYGDDAPIHISIAENELKPLLYSSNVYLVNLDIEDKSVTALLKDTQFHPVTDKPLHIDFLAPKSGAEITFGIPVRIHGSAPGVLAGGKLTINKRKVKLKASIENMPDSLTLDISDLKIGTGIRVKEISIPGVTILESPNLYIVQVKTARGAVETTEESAAPATTEASE